MSIRGIVRGGVVVLEGRTDLCDGDVVEIRQVFGGSPKTVAATTPSDPGKKTRGLPKPGGWRNLKRVGDPESYARRLRERVFVRTIKT
jgi:hypothetical protein